MIDQTRAAAVMADASKAIDRHIVNGDAAAAAALFSADGVLGESGLDDVVGRASIQDFLARADLVRRVSRHLTGRSELVFVSDDRAIEFGWFEETKIKKGKEPIEERGRMVTDWRRESDGAWRIARLVVSDLAPISAQP